MLPIVAALVGFRAQPDLANANGELQLTAMSVVDESKRIARPPVIGTRRYGVATAFFHDDQVFAEPAGFVPAAADPAATDRRFLGCWIEHRSDAR